MSRIDATLSIVDEDQGVCFEGHPCGLHVGRDFSRVCDTPHPDLDNEPYRGQPLVRWGLTSIELLEAQLDGADPAMVQTADAVLQEGLW